MLVGCGTADVPAASGNFLPRRCAERSFHWHLHGLGDARWRQEQTSGQGYLESRAQHHRCHRILQVARYGRLGTRTMVPRTSGEKEIDDIMATSATTNANDITTTVTVFCVDDCVKKKQRRVVWAVEPCYRWTDLRSTDGRFFNSSGVSVEDIVTFTLSCSETSRLRERRLQDESSEILFDVMSAHTTSADTFSNELTEVATDVESYFESSVSEIFNFTVEVAVTVTTDDDNDDIPVLPVVKKHVYTLCWRGVGRRLGSSVACPRGAGRRLRRRITCRCGADWRMSPRVTCPGTKSCSAGTDSRVYALWRPQCLWQDKRSVGESAEDRAEDL